MNIYFILIKLGEKLFSGKRFETEIIKKEIRAGDIVALLNILKI